MDNSLLNNLPTEEQFKKWQAIIKSYTDIVCDLETMKLALVLTIGRRIGMAKFSQFMPKEDRKNPVGHALTWYRNEDGTWMDIDEESDFRDSFIDSVCTVKFGMEHPVFGSSKEYKDEFKKRVANG